MRACLISVCLLLNLAQTLSAQQSRRGDSTKYPFLASMTDPACPVGNYRDPFPHTKNLLVLYFPNAQSATINHPKALSLHLVFEYGYFDGDRQTIPFTQRDDGNWVATIPLEFRPTLFTGLKSATRSNRIRIMKSISTFDFVTSTENVQKWA